MGKVEYFLRFMRRSTRRVVRIKLPEGDYLIRPGEVLELDGELEGEPVTFLIESL